jgi:hypothetical protein
MKFYNACGGNDGEENDPWKVFLQSTPGCSIGASAAGAWPWSS